ncbi:MAG: beta-propeller repeat protein [Candidatus Solibacter sp.]|nr:beta-propeller repeat protein [Candidatus Solibacter sp.]
MKSRVQFAVPALLFGLLCSCGPSGPPYKVYISNEGSGDLTVIDPVKMESLGTVAIGKRARGLHASADGKLIFVALSGSPFAPPGVDESTLPPPDKSQDGIGVYDIAANKMLRKVPGGSDPEQFAVGRDGLLYVSNEDAGGLSFVDPAKGDVLATVATGAEPEGVTLTPDAKFVYVTSEDKGTVTVVDTAARKPVKTIQVGRRPRGIVFLPDGTRAFVTNENDATLSVIDTSKLEVVKTIPVGAGMKPMGMAMNHDGSHLYVTTGRGKKVFDIQPATGNILTSFEVGDRPWGIALSPDEKLLFTANGPSNDISIVDVATHAVVKKVKVGEKPWGVLMLPREK